MNLFFPILDYVSRLFSRDKCRWQVSDPSKRTIYVTTEQLVNSDFEKIYDLCQQLEINNQSSRQDSVLIADLQTVISRLAEDVEADYRNNLSKDDDDTRYFYEVCPGIQKGELAILTGLKRVDNSGNQLGGRVYYGRVTRRIDEKVYAYWDC